MLEKRNGGDPERLACRESTTQKIMYPPEEQRTSGPLSGRNDVSWNRVGTIKHACLDDPVSTNLSVPLRHGKL